VAALLLPSVLVEEGGM
jgi:hypothetical protein